MNLTKHQKILLLGSNIQPEINLPKAIQLLIKRFRIHKVSNVWETPAVGSDGPDFLNAAVLLDTRLSPQELKARALRPMEVYLGRVRKSDKNAPRTIDIDVVIWGTHVLDDDIWIHTHAAVPIAELIPNIQNLQFQGTLSQVFQKFKAETPIRLRPDISRQIQSLLEGIPIPCKIDQKCLV
jgi:2-amino-4-hydroxy-6-hydroxymethyldihydropteridine diphosphokinase